MDVIIPRSLLLKHPQLAANLRQNQRRLTSHYDFYLTIRHLTRLWLLSDEPDVEPCCVQ